MSVQLWRCTNWDGGGKCERAEDAEQYRDLDHLDWRELKRWAGEL